MTIELQILILAGAGIGLVGGIIGYWWATTNQRREAGGKSTTELTIEKEQYEADVVEHFQTSAALLNEMTDKYRDVYRHMAEGAQKLAPGENVAPALAALQSGLLAAPGDPAHEAVIESETDDLQDDAAAQDVRETADENLADLNEVEPTTATTTGENDDGQTEQQEEESPVVDADDGSQHAVNDEQAHENAADAEPEEPAEKDFFSDDADETADLEQAKETLEGVEDELEKGK